MALECLSGEGPPSLWEGCSYKSLAFSYLSAFLTQPKNLCLAPTSSLHFPGSYLQNKLFLCKLLSLRYSVNTAESGNTFPSLPSFDIAVQATYPMLQFCPCCSAVPGAYCIRSEWAQRCPVALEPELWPEHYELFLLDGKEVYPVTVHCFLLWCSRHDF